MWDASKTPGTVQFPHWKAETPSWMVLTEHVRMPKLSALQRRGEEASTCSHFNMADGVQPVLRQKRHSTNMARAATAKMTVKAALGQTMFTSLKVSTYVHRHVGFIVV